MTRRRKIVQVPKADASSYNPDRPLSKNTLLLNQVRHFLEVEQTWPPEQRTGTKLEDLKTEADAGKYVSKVTAILHPQVFRIGG